MWNNLTQTSIYVTLSMFIENCEITIRVAHYDSEIYIVCEERIRKRRLLASRELRSASIDRKIRCVSHRREI